MSIVFSQVRTALYNWAVANTPSGMPVIYYYNNSPRPTVDYITLYITSVTQIGWDFIQQPLSDSGVDEQVGDREFTLQIQAYGGDPLTVLNNLRSSLQIPRVLDTLRANGIVLANWFPINDLTTLIDTRYEQRGSFDVLFRIADVYDDNSGVIDTVVEQEILKDATGTIVYNETFTIPNP